MKIPIRKIQNATLYICLKKEQKDKIVNGFFDEIGEFIICIDTDIEMRGGSESRNKYNSYSHWSCESNNFEGFKIILMDAFNIDIVDIIKKSPEVSSITHLE